MDRILMNYLKVSQHLSQQFRSHFGKVNLTFPQALALSIMGAEGPMPISKLAENMGSANSTISGIVDRLERLGLAKRTRSELDHRVIYVETTEKYLEIRERAKSGVNEYFNSLLDRLAPGEREDVANALEVLDRALTADRSSQGK
ncbi:MAG: MarR family transcriptional regulator [Oscillospiraceae bacterium]|nr:MarR family transcriptional regulator [Oscillospiraceae bacterium]